MTRRRLVAIGLALVLAVPTGGQALAHHGGRPIGSFSRCDRPVTPPRCTSVGNDLNHHVYFDATLTEGLASSLRDTMFEDYGPTKLQMLVDDELTATTDVIAVSEDFGENGAAGWVACPPDAPQGINPSGHRWCRGQELFFNLNPRYAVFFADDDSRDHVACHELGHTLGLRHWGNPPDSQGPAAATCMNSNTPNGPTELHEFDVDHINAYQFHTVPTRHMKLWWYSVVLADRGRPGIALAGLGAGSLNGATEVEPAGSLLELTASSDAVVRARVVSVDPGRVFGGRTGHSLHYAALTLAVDEVLAGALAADASRLTLEVPLFDGPTSIDALDVRGLDAIFFLRNKGESARAAGLSQERQAAEASFHRLVNFGALIGNDGGVSVTTDGPDAVAALGGTPFAEALERIRRAP